MRVNLYIHLWFWQWSSSKADEAILSRIIYHFIVCLFCFVLPSENMYLNVFWDQYKKNICHLGSLGHCEKKLKKSWLLILLRLHCFCGSYILSSHANSLCDWCCVLTGQKLTLVVCQWWRQQMYWHCEQPQLQRKKKTGKNWSRKSKSVFDIVRWPYFCWIYTSPFISCHIACDSGD